MKRLLLNIACVISLALCVVTASLWARSIFRFDAIYLDEQQVSGPYWKQKRTLVESGGKKLVICTEQQVYLPPEAEKDGGQFEAQLQWIRTSSGIKAYSGKGSPPWPPGLPKPLPGPVLTGGDTKIHLEMHYPSWTFLLGLLPLFWGLRKLRDWLEEKPGCCRVCGYDLRASKDRCPECGTPIPPDMPRPHSMR